MKLFKITLVALMLITTSCATVPKADEAKIDSSLEIKTDKTSFYIGRVQNMIGYVLSTWFNRESSAYSWYYRSAINGSPYGQYSLGLFYNKLDKKYEDKAIFWYKRAIKTDPKCSYPICSYPLNNLAGLYEENKEYKKAIDYYKKAIKLNNSNSMKNLGRLFERGLGVAKNRDEAKKLYLKAQKAGNTYSSIPLYFIYDKEKKPQLANSYAKKAYKILSNKSEAQIKNHGGFSSCRAGQILLTKEAGPINKAKAKKFFSWGKNRFNDPCCIKELEKLENP